MLSQIGKYVPKKTIITIGLLQPSLIKSYFILATYMIFHNLTPYNDWTEYFVNYRACAMLLSTTYRGALGQANLLAAGVQQVHQTLPHPALHNTW
jgi:uncharacterized membrane protein YjfL (UPF0719 family)